MVTISSLVGLVGGPSRGTALPCPYNALPCPYNALPCPYNVLPCPYNPSVGGRGGPGTK